MRSTSAVKHIGRVEKFPSQRPLLRQTSLRRLKVGRNESCAPWAMVSCRFAHQGFIYTFYSCTINVHYSSSFTWPWWCGEKATTSLNAIWLLKGSGSSFAAMSLKIITIKHREACQADIRRVPKSSPLHASFTSKTVAAISGGELCYAALYLGTCGVSYWSS